jgi:4-diphosphocytidyl-2-C-methyl-D-erythritol kinase
MPFSHLPESSVIARAPGKINLVLRVGPRRADGYHDLLTCFQAVDIWETVALSPADEFSIAVSGDVNLGEIPLDGNNLAMKAVAAVARATGRTDAVAILIDKKVPVGGGMGGGSADAAATLIAINELWHTGLSQVELLTIAAELGSDVPFLLEGGTAIGRGRGEILEPIKSLALSWVIVPSMEHLATPGVYGRLDELRADVDVVLPESLPDAFLDALYRGDPEALAPHLINDMAQASLDLEPELEATLEMGITSGALAVMVSGSGPTCAMLARDQNHAQAIQAACSDRERYAVVTSSPARGAHLVRR